MGTYTYTNFQAYLKLRMGNALEWESPVNYYGIWVNAAYKRLCASDRIFPIQKVFIFPELEIDTSETTEVGTGYVATPADCQVIRRVYHTTDNVKLDWMSFGQYVEYTDKATTANRAVPTKWHRRGANILLYPTPDNSSDSLRIFYKKRPAALSDNGDVTVLAAEWDEPILELAHHIARSWLNEWDLADKSKKALTEMEADIISAIAAEEKDRKEYWRPDPAYMEQGY